MASCARRLRGAVDAMAESIDRILDTIEVEQQVSRLGQLIALQRQALEAHGFQDFADFQSCSQASSSPQDLAALQRLQASERRWRELLQRLEATAGRAVGGIALGAQAPPVVLQSAGGDWVDVQRLCERSRGVLLVWLRHFG
ncbi:unnamed protein product [Durusdinium trenchii]|uniref:Uncharacterized protein n=2 Tax=Durusdinium trenchii TaxID=1381693 RepID=A0ABP0K5B8_9DINO